MSRWFRFQSDALRHPKVAGLSDGDKVLWIELLSAACENDGELPPLRTLNGVLKRRLDHLSKALDRLVKAGLIDVLNGGGFTPHNWKKYQFESDVSTKRVRAFRSKRNVSYAFRETPPHNKTEQKEVSVPNGTAADAAVQGDLLVSQNSLRPPINGGTVPVAEKEKKEDPKAELFRRGRAVLGKSSGGHVAKLLRHFGDEDDPRSIAKARAQIEEASTKTKPGEWIGRVLSPKNGQDKTATDPWGNAVSDWRSVL